MAGVRVVGGAGTPEGRRQGAWQGFTAVLLMLLQQNQKARPVDATSTTLRRLSCQRGPPGKRGAARSCHSESPRTSLRQALPVSAQEGTSALGRPPGVGSCGPLPRASSRTTVPTQGATGRAGAIWSTSEWADMLAPWPVQDVPEEARLPTRGGTLRRAHQEARWSGRSSAGQ